MPPIKEHLKTSLERTGNEYNEHSINGLMAIRKKRRKDMILLRFMSMVR